MSNGMAINGYGYGYYDPYFLQAYQYNQYMNGQAAAAVQNAQNAQSSTQTVPVGQPAAKEESKKSSGKAWAILGTVAVVGAAILCRKAYKAGNGADMISKTKDGFKVLWNGLKDKAGKFVNPEKFSVMGEGESTLCKIPGRTNIMRTGDAAAGLAAIGESASVTELTKEAIQNGSVKLRSFSFKDGKNVVKVVKGKIVECAGVKGDSTMSIAELLGESEYKRLMGLVSKFQQGENLSKLTNITYSQKLNGVSKLFEKASASKVATLKAAVADRYAYNSEAVKAFCVKNPAYKEALTKYVAGDKAAWKIVKGEYAIPDVGTLLFKNDKITGIRIGNEVYGTNSEKYLSLLSDNKDVFEKAIEHKKDFTNTVLQLA